ncbi:hypothetical protein KPH14_009334 [Odynerus spinipes]|uniref:RING-type domain-containing protein n=1 Tax=Odynerus spinipes TaxID=1348599 RepID=A0AAD9RPE7_9HYME|nr:hypothetical protein KPH14_009334 [Odynerus spinipes]
METCEKEKPLVKDLNEHIVCPLCRGYLVDATTLTECLHSFCRGCIVRRLSSGARLCPVCNVSASPPLLPDPRLQRLVYLVVPGLFRSELERRRHFRLVNPQCPPLPSPLGALELTLDDFVSLSLRELPDSRNEENREVRSASSQQEEKGTDAEEDGAREPTTRYLKCPAAVTVRHLVRLLTLKRGWEDANSAPNANNRIEMTCEDYNGDPRSRLRKPDVLDMSWTLLDLACIFGWKKEAPLKLFYRIVRKDETASASKGSPCNDDNNKDGPTIENIQRPPTPPPSPKPVQENDAEPPRRTFDGGTEAPRALETAKEREKETKSKKPRCEVTPVMRAPDPVGISSIAIQQSNHSSESSRTKELARLEHRKRRKRRNKRVIAEITTTPREDLLKLKVRLTPCPPRITSSSSSGQTKEKLLQMRAVRREKIKASAMSQQRSIALPREEGNAGKEGHAAESEETIEDIIDCIPDEVVRVAQNITAPPQEDGTREKKEDQKSPKVLVRRKEESQTETRKSPIEEVGTTADRPKKDEEILRRLGLVAINEANESLRDKTKQRGQNYNEKPNDLDREKLEKQLRESKANRVRSLLAEKQMRDALKGIMSKTKEEGSSSSSAQGSGTTSSATPCPKKKGPPPLAPLRVAKPSSGFGVTSTMVESNNPKYETPLDLSSAGTVNDNVLDLSSTLQSSSIGFSASSSSSSPSPSSSSSSCSSSSSSSSSSICTPPSLPLLRPQQNSLTMGGFLRKSKELEQRRGQDTNLRTLSDAAVSRLSGCIPGKNSVEPLLLGTSAIAASKVALRIPQPHHRISGYGMKNKPNLGVRHIPNPQAVVASQYRNQRAIYFNALSQHPP